MLKHALFNNPPVVESDETKDPDLAVAGPEAVRCSWRQRWRLVMPAPENDACTGIPVQDVGVAIYQGRALAEINLSGVALAEALEAFICRRDPRLENQNVQVRRATPTGDVETRVQPHKRWYEVVFETDDIPEDDEDDDDDTFEARKKAKEKAKAAAKAQVKTWPPANPMVLPPDPDEEERRR